MPPLSHTRGFSKDVLTMNRLQASTKVIIVDWDDTILPSTFVDRLQIENSRDLPLHSQNLLADLGRCAEKFLKEASRYGEVIIITNSDEGWVNYSAERYCPYLLKVVENYRVVSARTRYERFYPGQPLCWKAAAFAHEVNEIYESLKDDDECVSMEGTDVSSTSSQESAGEMEEERVTGREIISFGDSGEERTAVRIVSDQLDARSKSVKMITSPTPLQLIGQLYMLTNHMKFVCENRLTLDLEISTEQADGCANIYMKRNKLGYEHNVVVPDKAPLIQYPPTETTAEVAPVSA